MKLDEEQNSLPDRLHPRLPAQQRGQSFTPGPWRLEEDDWRHVLANSGESETEVATVWLQEEGVGQINARLIAAAPDLYAACKFALTTPGMIKGRDEMIAALKLANGQRDE